MKKISFILTAALLFAGCSKAQSPSTPKETEIPTSNGSSPFQFSGTPMSCTLTKKDGTSSMTYKMKEKKMRVTGIASADGKNGQNMIKDDQYMYTWDDLTKKGMKIAVSTIDDLANEATRSGQSVPSLASEADKKKYENEGYAVNCTEASISDADFVPPTDVIFQDTDAMLKQSKTMMQKLQGSDTPASVEEMQKQAEEMMKQYQQ